MDSNCVYFEIKNQKLAEILKKHKIDLATSGDVIYSNRVGCNYANWLEIADEGYIEEDVKSDNIAEWMISFLYWMGNVFCGGFSTLSDENIQNAIAEIEQNSREINNISNNAFLIKLCWFSPSGSGDNAFEVNRFENGKLDTNKFYEWDYNELYPKDDRPFYQVIGEEGPEGVDSIFDELINQKTNGKVNPSYSDAEALSSENGFTKINKLISIKEEPYGTSVLVNNEWTFIIPFGIDYETDGVFDGGIEGAADLSGDEKPLILNGLYQDGKYWFNVALQEHFSLLGNQATIEDCKYDNRFDGSNPSASRIVFIDEDYFYAELICINIWPLGTQLEFHVRGRDIAPFDFITNIPMNASEAVEDEIIDIFKEIGNSICFIGQNNAPTTSKSEEINPFGNEFIVDGTVLLKYTGNSSEIVVPEGITALADNIFSGRQNLRSILLPESVTRIGNRAFENCCNLEYVKLPSKLKDLGVYAFVDCHSLNYINLSNDLTSIPGSAFSECYELKDVEIPKNVKIIDAFAFKNCQEFTQLVLPEGLTTISFSAFSNCKNLEYIYIPATVTTIEINFGEHTPFSGCNKLTVYCPEGSYAQQFMIENGIRYEIAEKPREITPISQSESAENLKELGRRIGEPIANKQKISDVYRKESKRLAEMGENFADEGQNYKALSFYERALKYNPYNPKATMGKGLIFSDGDDIITKTVKIRKNCAEPLCKLLNVLNTPAELQELAFEIEYLLGYISGFSSTVEEEKSCYIDGGKQVLYENIIKNLGETLLYIGDAIYSKNPTLNLKADAMEAWKKGVTLCYNNLTEYRNGKANDYLTKIKQQEPDFVIENSYDAFGYKENQKASNEGCYIATCVYGSYDCPQVWTLRRYRDNKLAKSYFGKIFIKFYYATSPTLVKWFGNIKWFKLIWKKYLDKMVSALREDGYADTPYQDQHN